MTYGSAAGNAKAGSLVSLARTRVVRLLMIAIAIAILTFARQYL